MIKVFSTYTTDVIYNMDHKKKTIRKGGPAFFIENVLKDNKIEHEIHAGKAKININIKNKIERGFLDSVLRIDKIKNIQNNDIVVVSTVDREWVLGSVSAKAKIFLDIQGHIRNSRINSSVFKSDFWKKVFCMKMNEEEMKELPNKIILSQKKKMMIITRGSNGFSIYFKGKKFDFKVNNIEASDYIGSGDTFFAGFIVGLIKKNYDIIKSGNFAIREVTKFLLSKK